MIDDLEERLVVRHLETGMGVDHVATPIPDKQITLPQ